MIKICDVMKTIGIGMIPIALLYGLVFLFVKFPWIIVVLLLSGFCYILGGFIRKDYNRIYQHLKEDLKDIKEDYERETNI